MPNPDKTWEAQLGKPDIKVAGFQIWVHGHERPDLGDYYDGNWLLVTAHSGAPGASVWASGAILMVPDLADWGYQCDALANGETQEAKLAPLEPEVQVLIRKIDSLGHFAMCVQITPDHLHQKHWFEFEIDQTHLREIARQCRSITTAYPARGEAGGDP